MVELRWPNELQICEAHKLYHYARSKWRPAVHKQPPITTYAFNVQDGEDTYAKINQTDGQTCQSERHTETQEVAAAETAEAPQTIRCQNK